MSVVGRRVIEILSWVWNALTTELTAVVLALIVFCMTIGGWVGWWLELSPPRAVVFGDVFTGLAALATIATVALASISVVTERRDRLVAQAETRQAKEETRQVWKAEEERRLREQADQVTWWTRLAAQEPQDLRLEAYLGRTYYGGAPGYTAVNLHIRNSSHNAIYDCVVSRGKGPTGSAGIIPPGESVYLEYISDAILSSGQEMNLNARVSMNGAPVHYVQFTDTEGRVWTRSARGRLDPVGESTEQDLKPQASEPA